MRHFLRTIVLFPNSLLRCFLLLRIFGRETNMLNIRSMLKLIENGPLVRNVFLYKGSAIEMPKTSKLVVENGPFKFNQKWLKNDPFPSVLVFRENATIIVKNNFQIFSGAKVHVNKNATLMLGSGYINSNLSLSCYESIEIGEDVAISENVTIRDSDNHTIKGSELKNTSPIKIGNHVWIGMNAIILKGVTIGDGAVICAGTLVHRNVKANTMVAGNPQMVVKENVSWE
jgi:acetyltransferase-like isoleucine patch superfamily enzyme